jgi:4'-phosphopantetheinyl transferase
MLIQWQEQNETDVPADDGWLGSWELPTLARMRFARRRAEWRLGRSTAKSAVSACLRLPATLETLRELEIRSAPSGAPEVFFANGLAGLTLSLSHRSGLGVCAVAQTCRLGPALGCDLERIEPHSDPFLADYFTIEEQSQVREAASGDRCRLVALLWSAKESLLKALRLGLRVDTRSVNVKLELPPVAGTTGWYALRVQYADVCTPCGWWSESAGFVRTLVVVPFLGGISPPTR